MAKNNNNNTTTTTSNPKNGGARFLAFLLGFIVGIVFILGGTALGAYIAAKNVTPNKVSPDASNYLGDLAAMSFWDIGEQLVKLYQTKAGNTDEDGNYFSLGDFCTMYNIDISKAKLPEEVLEVPVFEFFSEGGVQRGLAQVKVSAIPAIANMFGVGSFGQETLDELSKYGINDLMAEGGFARVFENVRLAALVPSAFPAEESDNTLMWAIGQTCIGKVLSASSGSESMMLQLREGGALETLGSIQMTQLVGSEGIFGSILQDATLAALVDDNGKIAIEGLLEDVYLGTVLSCKRVEVTDISAYTEVCRDENTVVLYNSVEGNYIMSCEDKYYIANIVCTDDSAEHEHNLVSCFNYQWYNEDDTPAEGYNKAFANLKLVDMLNGDTSTIVAELEKLTIAELLGDKELDPVMESFASMTIKELMEGGIDSIYLGAVLSYKRSEVVGTPADYTELKSGEEVVAYVAHLSDKLVMSDDNKTWYEAQLKCDDTDPSHIHDRSCYSYIWKDTEGNLAEGLVTKLVDKKVSELKNIEDTVNDLTLREVLGDEAVGEGLLAQLADTRIADISNKIDSMLLGNVFGFIRNELSYDSTYTAVITDVVYKNNDGTLLKVDTGDGKWYQAELTCSEEHEHTADCYGYVWYEKIVLDASHECDLAVEYVDADGHHARVAGVYTVIVDIRMMELTGGDSSVFMNKIQKLHIRDLFLEEPTGFVGKFADLTVYEMMHGDVEARIKNMTLQEFMGDEELTGVLASMSDMTINELMDGGVDALYVGEFLNYTREGVTVTGSPVKTELKNDGGVTVAYLATVDTQLVMCDVATDGSEEWYKAKLVCSDETHGDNHTLRSCYSYIWIDETNTEVSGLMAPFADKKVSEMSNIDKTVQTLTLADVMGRENLEGLLLEMADVKICDLSSTVQTLYVGSAMNYSRHIVENIADYADTSITYVKELSGAYARSDDGEKWYQAEFTCTETDPAHTHTIDCYGYVWYDESDVAITGITKAFVNSKLNNLNATIDDLTLNKLGIAGNNNLMTALGDVKLKNIGTELDNITLGTVFGYVKHNELWYTQCTESSCTHEHTTIPGHDGNYVQVKGVNAKMADKSMSDLTDGNGMSAIVQGLTVQDLIDSEMMTLSDAQMMKLDLLFCEQDIGGNKCTTSYKIKEGALFEQTIHCNWSGYIAYNAAEGEISISDFYHLFDSQHTAECTNHKWMALTLANFIDALLNALN